MNLEERLEKTMLAITFAEDGKHEWARKLLSELDKQRRHKAKNILRDRLATIQLYLETLGDRKVKIEKQKLFNSKHYLIFIKNLTGLVRHHLIFTYQFVSENTTVEIIEKLMSWNLADLLAKAGKHVVLVSDQGLYVPSLGGLNR
ncbi:MAG: hypothetical protein LJE89_02735 [Deltaproteobacteria bacterium]|nr:hypothetical protein [Deltaproteobacteria bacterium]